MEGISVLFDKQTGYTKGIYDPRDDFAMNWILENSDWGAVEGFAVREVEETANGIIVRGVNKAEHLQLVVKKSVTEEKYVERYQITNIGASEFFLTRDNFGIHFPYNCTFEGKEHLQLCGSRLVRG